MSEQRPSLVLRVVAGVAQRWCGLRGHQTVLCVEPHRLSLQCVSCGWQSHGWMCG